MSAYHRRGRYPISRTWTPSSCRTSRIPGESYLPCHAQVRLAFNHYVSIPCIKPHTPFAADMGFIDNVSGGFAVAFGVTAVIAIANGLSTYVFDGQTLSDKVTSRIGGSN